MEEITGAFQGEEPGTVPGKTILEDLCLLRLRRAARRLPSLETYQENLGKAFGFVSHESLGSWKPRGRVPFSWFPEVPGPRASLLGHITTGIIHFHRHFHGVMCCAGCSCVYIP